MMHGFKRAHRAVTSQSIRKEQDDVPNQSCRLRGHSFGGFSIDPPTCTIGIGHVAAVKGSKRKRWMMSFAESGKKRRLARLFRHTDGRTLILPIDDGLISGPRGGLLNLSRLLKVIASDPPDGILLFCGVLSRYWFDMGMMTAIVNVTASTRCGTHSRKLLCTKVETALASGADLVAVHVNVTSRYDSEMLSNLGMVVGEAEKFGLPVLAIMYPRREVNGCDDNYNELKNTEPQRYTELVAHAARIGMELGADVIKTQYTGSPDTFEKVVEAAHPVPVVIAGGPLSSEAAALSSIRGAVKAGGRGVSFGRNVFERRDPADMLRLIRSSLHE